MTLRKILSVVIRLILMTGFFLGLVLLIRFEVFWKIVAGIGLMITTVPLSYWLGSAIAQSEKPASEKPAWESLREITGATLPVVGPIVLFFLMLAIITYYSQTGDARIFFLVLLMVVPLFVVLSDAISGKSPWQATALANAYTKVSAHMMGRLIYVLGGLLVLALAILAVISLFLTLGDFIRLGLFSSKPLSSPLLCQIPPFHGSACTVKLFAWHSLSLLAFIIVWRHGHTIHSKIMALLIRP